MAVAAHRHVFPVLEALIDEAMRDMDDDGVEISCRRGCSHCCHLLVEISMEEAQALARWVYKQPADKQATLIQAIKKNARSARKIFKNSKNNQAHVGAVGIDDDIGEDCFDEYFYDKSRPCPFLKDNACQAYSARPSSCRLHMVSSDPDLCRHDVDDDSDYEVPERIEELHDEFAPINTAVSRDGRWGHLGILVEIALKELAPSAA